MPTKIDNRRGETRTPLPEYLRATIRVRAAGGLEQEYRLLELSMSGASFVLPQRTSGIETGDSLENVVLCVGDLEVASHAQVLHVSRLEGNAYACGVRLFPAGEEDRNELSGLVSRLESLPQ